MDVLGWIEWVECTAAIRQSWTLLSRIGAAETRPWENSLGGKGRACILPSICTLAQRAWCSKTAPRL